eukprot:scaffold156017_cov22-Tisochrysis_lutea.AAC.1
MLAFVLHQPHLARRRLARLSGSDTHPPREERRQQGGRKGNELYTLEYTSTALPRRCASKD